MSRFRGLQFATYVHNMRANAQYYSGWMMIIAATINKIQRWALPSRRTAMLYRGALRCAEY